MRPLTVTVLSLLASIGLAAIAHSYALQLELSQTISPTMFTNLLIVVLCVVAALVCIWIALSYLALAYAQRTAKQKSVLISFAARLATPHVRRALASGAIALSLVIAQPAYAEENSEINNEAPVDISWGSPDLLDIAVQSGNNDELPESASLTETSPEASNEIQTSSTPENNPLTSAPTPTDTNTGSKQFTIEMPTHSLSPPPLSHPSDPPPTSYTVKSGDTLWAIAKAYLPPDATDSDIARACLVWAQANPQLANPNLIYPGQPLTIPQENLA